METNSPTPANNSKSAHAPAAPNVVKAAAPAPAAAAAKPAAPVAPPAPPPPVPSELAKIDLPFTGADFAVKGYHADAKVEPQDVVSAAEKLDEAGFAIDTITGVDWMAEGQMEVVYDFFHYHQPWRVVVRTRIPRDNPELPTISGVFPGANWHERETHDFFGIRFAGHPNLTPFLLPEDATFHPLKKDFTS